MAKKKPVTAAEAVAVMNDAIAEVETPSRTPAQEKAIEFLKKILSEPANATTHLDAAEALIKLTGAVDAELEARLLILMDPPGEKRERIRAARLLLGV
jgi:DNA-directed RNA polymerase subunit F